MTIYNNLCIFTTSYYTRPAGKSFSSRTLFFGNAYNYGRTLHARGQESRKDDTNDLLCSTLLFARGFYPPAVVIYATRLCARNRRTRKLFNRRGPGHIVGEDAGRRRGVERNLRNNVPATGRAIAGNRPESVYPPSRMPHAGDPGADVIRTAAVQWSLRRVHSVRVQSFISRRARAVHFDARRARTKS